MKVRILMICILASHLMLLSDKSIAQSTIFENPKNLKVLPKDISAAELSATMRGFATGLGVRCSSCHVGEEGKPLSSFDFAADDKPMKAKARIMLQMVNEINHTFVPKLDSIEAVTRVEVGCVSCHRGQSKPLLIQDVLSEAVASGKPGAALEKYNSLRKRYYGSHTYDFGAFVLPGFSDQLLKDGNHQVALELMEVNQSHYPNTYYGNFIHAKALQHNKRYEAAISAYQKALEINPKAVFINRIIQKLNSQPPE